MKLFFISFLFLSGCGDGIGGCDFIESNLCVRTNGFEIDQNILSETINIVDKNLDFFFQKSNNIQTTFEENNVRLWYVERLKSENRGETNNDGLMTIKHSECFDNYYVPAHEMLHVFAYFEMLVPNKDNSAHNVPNLFWEDNKATVESGVAFDLQLLLYDFCNLEG